MAIPSFKNYDDLGPAELAAHKVWVSCHLSDYDEPWYDQVDEEAFRPWSGEFPIPRSKVVIVSAAFQTKSGRQLTGYIENWGELVGEPLLDLKPSLFDEKGRPIKFWHGATYQFGMKFLNDAKQRLESLLGGRLTSHFPIMLTVDADIFGEKIEVDIQGFGSFAAPNQIVVVNSG